MQVELVDHHQLNRICRRRRRQTHQIAGADHATGDLRSVSVVFRKHTPAESGPVPTTVRPRSPTGGGRFPQHRQAHSAALRTTLRTTSWNALMSERSDTPRVGSRRHRINSRSTFLQPIDPDEHGDAAARRIGRATNVDRPAAGTGAGHRPTRARDTGPQPDPRRTAPSSTADRRTDPGRPRGRYRRTAGKRVRTTEFRGDGRSRIMAPRRFGIRHRDRLEPIAALGITQIDEVRFRRRARRARFHRQPPATYASGNSGTGGITRDRQCGRPEQRASGD